MNTKKQKWAPLVELNIFKASARALKDVIEEFNRKSESVELPKINLPDGWHDITPQDAENLLRHNKGNRRVSLTTVQYFAQQMLDGVWKKTGEPVIVSNTNGVEALEDSQHRNWAAYFTGSTYPTYVVNVESPEKDLFAYIDNGKARTVTDALQTAGVNGIASALSRAIKIGREYDAGCYSLDKVERLSRVTPIEALDAVRHNPDLEEAGRLQLRKFEAATDLINDKGVACFVAWRVFSAYGDSALEGFMSALEEEDCKSSSIVLLQKQLMSDTAARKGKKGKKLRKHIKLGLITKVFHAWRLGKELTSLGLATNEPWPTFEEPVAEAAE
jgi:hypothetical protein